MNQLEIVRSQIAQELPQSTLRVDRPAKPHGAWWLDADFEGHSVTVEWRPGRGFGISASEDPGYGEGPDETYADAAAATERVLDLLRRRANTKPPRETILKRLREIRRVSQQTLASSLKVTQATVSKMERRSDMYISTLRRTIAALGGELEIRARFPEGVVKISQFEDLAQEPVESSRRGIPNRLKTTL